MFDALPLRILIVTLAGWVNRHQLEVIQYLREENRVLKERLGGRRLRLTDAASEGQPRPSVPCRHSRAIERGTPRAVAMFSPRCVG